MLAPALSAWLAGCWLAIITATTYIGDDLINKDIRAAAAERGTDLGGLIGHYTSQWMTEQGRFFPGSLGWSYTVFWVTEVRVPYKFVLGAVLVACVAACALLSVTLTGRWRVAPALVASAVCFVQVRVGFDAIIGFAGLVPLTLGLCAAAIVLLVRGRGWVSALVAAALYSMALVTYETVILFVPAMAALVVYWRRRWLPALALVVPAALAAGAAVVLRGAVRTPTLAAYTVDLDPHVVVPTFAKQALAALPMSQWILGAPGVPSVPTGAVVVAALVCGLPVAALMLSASGGPLRASWAAIVSLGGFGLWIWLTSALLTGITVRWQEEVHRGQGYLSVVYGYLGCALLACAIWLVGERLVADRSRTARAAWRITSALVIAAVATATMAGNLAITSLV
ncbi:hypothetical protein HP550_05925 [Cellulomonas humilata]|uniref:Glycosyltransferase RgtA/B/C/D-like domain-containing protein n=1 Tax=Cellulomonas humilata TaxID=144055 RepID=A0A7Y5ZZ70_9CELL|nr:hypothetical protein [Cellulomonas humilata]NUU16786.1 hypothetical protein [Cellulomonas humilata]